MKFQIGRFCRRSASSNYIFGVDLVPCIQFAHAQSTSRAWIYKNDYEPERPFCEPLARSARELLRNMIFLTSLRISRLLASDSDHFYGEQVLLRIDTKFPREDYEHLQEAIAGSHEHHHHHHKAAHNPKGGETGRSRLKKYYDRQTQEKLLTGLEI
jgi:hypothetical protein